MMLDAPPRNVAMSNNEGASTSSSNQQEKKLEGEELLYNPLLSQQQQLLQLHQVCSIVLKALLSIVSRGIIFVEFRA